MRDTVYDKIIHTFPTLRNYISMCEMYDADIEQVYDLLFAMDTTVKDL